MKNIFLALFLILFGVACSNKNDTQIRFSSNRAYDSLSLYAINGTNATHLGALSQGETYWELTTGLDQPAILKLYQYPTGGNRTSTLIMLENDQMVTLIESETGLTCAGSIETSRLLEVNKLLESCDKTHYEFQRKLIQVAPNIDSINYYTNLNTSHQNRCFEDMKSLIRLDPSSLASLYALNFVDPKNNRSLIDSVYCSSIQRYPSIYLHKEILAIHQINEGSINCD